MTAAGHNLAKFVVEDRVYKRDLGECVENTNEVFWHSVPRKVVYDYVKDPEFVERAKKLVAVGKESMTFDYPYDLRFNPMRWAWVKIHVFRYFDKFKNPENYR